MKSLSWNPRRLVVGFAGSVLRDGRTEGDDTSGGGDGDDTTSGGSGGDGDSAEIARLTAELDAVKKNRDKFKSEKANASKRLEEASTLIEQLGGDDGIATLLNFKKKLESDEFTKLIAAGKHDEAIALKTKALQSDHQKTVNGLTERAEDAEKRAESAELKYQRYRLSAEVMRVAATTEGFVESALPDAILLAESTFNAFDESDNPAILEEDETFRRGKDGQSNLHVEEWFASLKDDGTRRHWFGDSTSGGAGGNTGGSGGSGNSLQGLGFKEFKARRAAQEKAKRG